MKQSIYNIFPGILILVFFLPSLSPFDAEKTIHMNFKVETPADLVVSNEYGEIYISTWEKNEIDISIDIRARSGLNSHAEKFVKGTEVDFNQKGNKVYARTKPGPRKSSSKWIEWFAGNETFEINYTIHVPDHINLDLENKHGDINIGRFDGDLKVELEHGDMKTDYITGAVKLDVKHSDVIMKGMGNGKMDISYSDFSTQRAGNLQLKTTNSELNISEALNLTIFSKYDHYIIGNMDNLINEGAYDDFEIIKLRSIDMTTRFTDVDIDLCEINFQIEMVHGKASIDHISAAFDEGEINSKNAEIELAFEGKVNMDLTTEHTELDFSDRITTNSSRMDGNKKYVSAFIGDGTMKKNLSIHMEHGSLEIR